MARCGVRTEDDSSSIRIPPSQLIYIFNLSASTIDPKPFSPYFGSVLRPTQATMEVQ